MTAVLSQVLGTGLIPHIEEAALDYIFREYVMPARVSIFSDMTGFNIRKISQYLPPRMAQELQEATDIPATELLRARLSEVTIKEYGDRYPITDRRYQTDPEDIVADTGVALGKAIGDRLEYDLINAGINQFLGGTLGNASTVFSSDLAIDAQYEFAKIFGTSANGILYEVLHPFAARDTMKTLIKFDGSDAGAALDYRNEAIRSWTVPGFGNLDISQSSFIPRRVLHRIRVAGTGGTFRLSVAGLTTGAITVSTTPATMATNIKTALDALSIGTWTVADGGGGLLDIDVTPPTTLYTNADMELTVAIDRATPTLRGYKSAYDLVTGTTGALGTDRNAVAYGVDIQERDASAKNLVFYRQALILDERQAATGYFENVNQGRTSEFSLYTKYGVGGWQPTYGMFIESKAASKLAVP